MYEENVRRGIKWLDTYSPDWKYQINLEKLDLSSECNCVFGQIFGSYSKGIDVFKKINGYYPSISTRAYNGFTVERHGYEVCLDKKYRQLTNEWKNQLVTLNCGPNSVNF